MKESTIVNALVSGDTAAQVAAKAGTDPTTAERILLRAPGVIPHRRYDGARVWVRFGHEVELPCAECEAAAVARRARLEADLLNSLRVRLRW